MIARLRTALYRSLPRTPPSDLGNTADAALRAAVLLRGGVPAGRVWRLLGEDPLAPRDLKELAARIAQGQPVSSAMVLLETEEWNVLAATWLLAERTGAPFATVLERIAAALQSLERLGQRRSVLLAGPRATIRLVASLPLLALVLGWVLGFDPAQVMFSSFGMALAVTGGGLLALGMRWANHMIKQLAAADWVAGLECELAWVAMSGGLPPSAALRRIADSVDATGASWVKLSTLSRGGSVRNVISAATNLGAPVATMLLAEAEALRATALTELERQAERLGVRVLLPIGLCVLPSFIVLGVIPVLAAVLGNISIDSIL